MRGPRLVLIGSILGSGAVFVEGTVTTVAMPAIGRDLHLGIAGLQWVMNGYLLTLSSLILLGGSLGDRFVRRRVFAIGLVGFALETDDQRFRALVKLEKKSCDLMVLNGPAAMDALDNQVEVLDETGQVIAALDGSKEEVAQGILQVVKERLIS